MNYRAAITRALDALELGDPQEATETLLSALEDAGPRIDRAFCRGCGQGFEWPGLRDNHERICSEVAR